MALDDALVCIGKDPKYLKGYYRLATAQIELSQFDDAEASIKAGEAIDAGKFLYNVWYASFHDVMSRQ